MREGRNCVLAAWNTKCNILTYCLKSFRIESASSLCTIRFAAIQFIKQYISLIIICKLLTPKAISIYYFPVIWDWFAWNFLLGHSVQDLYRFLVTQIKCSYKPAFMQSHNLIFLHFICMCVTMIFYRNLSKSNLYKR